MNVEQALQERRSVRAFLPQPIGGATVRELLDGAAQSPSGGNLQPWRVIALSGAALTEVNDLARNNEPLVRPGLSYPPELWEPYRTRRFSNGEDLYRAIGVAREDKAARHAQFATNGELFGAPVGVFVAVDERMGHAQWMDLGIFLQSFMLQAVAKGLATCAQGYWRMYNQLLTQQLALPAGYQVAFGIALGYEDKDALINQWRSSRAPTDKWLTLRGFA